MRMICMSDTHNKKPRQVPDGDVLVHAGDATIMGSLGEIRTFAKWFGALPHANKIFVPGNHDWGFDKNNPGLIHPLVARSILEYAGVTVLVDASVKLSGLNFYGSPWQPEFHGWAFNLPRGLALRNKWDAIPQETNVLITHGPAAGVRDSVAGGPPLGCEDLRDCVMRLPDLKAHVFGHIHDGYGTTHDSLLGMVRVNASICNENYDAVNFPIAVDLT